MRYFKCLKWQGTFFTEGEIYPFEGDELIDNVGEPTEIFKWMEPMFQEVFMFSDYLKEVEKQ